MRHTKLFFVLSYEMSVREDILLYPLLRTSHMGAARGGNNRTGDQTMTMSVAMTVRPRHPYHDVSDKIIHFLPTHNLFSLHN